MIDKTWKVKHSSVYYYLFITCNWNKSLSADKEHTKTILS